MIFQFDKNVLKILSVFATSPGSNFLRKQIQEFSMINNIVLDKTLRRLINSCVLARDGRFYCLNLSNSCVKDFLKDVSEEYHKLKDLPLGVYSIILELVFGLVEVKNLGDVYLFGSYSKLVYSEDSDIDIAIVSDGVDRKKVNVICKKMKSRYGKRVDVHFFGKDFYKNKRDALVKEILKDGIKLMVVGDEFK